MHPRFLLNTWERRDWIALLTLAVTLFALYFQTRRFDFINFDDQAYVYENPHITNGISLDSIRYSIFVAVNSNWHPLTTLGWLFIEGLWGPRASAFHLVNATLHILNAGLLFVFLRNAVGRCWPAFCVAALWGLHPLRVESVAWVSELKDVLCGTLWLLCMLAYLRYSRRRTIWNYLLVFVLHALSLAGKPMAVTLPAALLLLDYWPLRHQDSTTVRWWSFRLLEKLPLLLLSMADIAYAAVVLGRTESATTLRDCPMPLRLENAIVSTALYLRDTIFPSRLAIFYPHPVMRGGLPAGLVIASGLLLLAITVGICIAGRARKYVSVGWFWFLGTMMPVIGLVQVGEQARADRFTYIPAIGLTVAVVWLIDDLISKSRPMRLAAGTTTIVAAIVLGVVTYIDIGYWKDSTTLFAHADKVIPDNYLAKSILAFNLHMSGNFDEALRLSNQATALAPNSRIPRFTRGLVFLDLGRLDEAATAFTMDEMTAKDWYELGMVRAAQANVCMVNHQPGEIEFRNKACDCFRSALKEDRGYWSAEDALGDQTARLGHLAFAIHIWRDLLQRAPKYGPSHGHLADALRVSGNISEAVEQYRQAVDLGERDPSWETNLAYLMATAPGATVAEVQPMVDVATDARDQTNGKDPAALDALAACLARVGRFDDAITTAQSAVQQARSQQNPKLAEQIQKRLAQYQNGQPYISYN